MRAVLLVCTASAVILSVTGQDCWWTGCQLDHWATKGCAQYDRVEKGREPCPGGKKYHCCSGNPGAPQPGPGVPGDISQDQFDRACRTRRGSGGSDQFNSFKRSLQRARISDKMEMAKYLAHTVWESLGLSAMREELCQNPANDQQCRNAYGSGPGGVIYYGRGPMQLSHHYNYRAASQEIFGDANVLLNDPDRVARDSQTGWDTAAYFWSANVHDNAQTFGSTLKKINGALECDGGSAGQNMWKRCDHYREVLQILGLPVPHDRQYDCYCRV